VEPSLTVARILAFITPWALPTSLIVLIVGAVVDVIKKRFHWSKFALIFLMVTAVLLIIQIKLIYSVTGGILNNP
jgi:1,4-dihydroxy-2-naphthoate octaprenyltransferase